MFEKVLIANRGAIACRIVRTLQRMGIGSGAVYSEADRHSLHVTAADEAVFLGPSAPAESYLRQEKLIEAARATGAGAIHPGYGFLSENAAFAAACESAGIAFIGPTPAQIRDFGLKHRARALAQQNGLPLLPGSGLVVSVGEAQEVAQRIGYPVMLKSTAGGGGIGMKWCRDAAELSAAYASVERLARSHFSDGGLYIEKYIAHARHIEVQLFGDGAGTVIALGERDCSRQRRNQKVLEEAPAPGLSDIARERLCAAAVRLGQAVGYRSAGTVEFVYDVPADEFYCRELNPRLQVEHGVTEAVMGVDLVERMIRVAAGEPPPLASFRSNALGHAIQARLYAEDPGRGFRPSSGPLSQVTMPTGVRVDTWIETGSEVSAFYDALLAKIIVHGPTRDSALMRLDEALAQISVHGIETNLDYLRTAISTPTFQAGEQFTRFLPTLAFPARSVEVLRAGTHATLQDYPGRLRFWNVGVPPSGPMDDLAFRLANRIVGNAPGLAGLELTGKGPTLQFGVDSVIALTGARMTAELDGSPAPFWQPICVKAGSVLALGGIQGTTGARSYLAVKGGFDVPEYLGSRSTFTLGQFGGHVGRALRIGDVLRLMRSASDLEGCAGLAAEDIPVYGNHWDVAVTYGPHGAPDFFTQSDIDMLFETHWEVHYNSITTGVRLIGPKPQWARAKGEEAVLHPSNIHDNAYAIGAIDYTGDMPVILGPDGPSLGGFVCPAVIVPADLWKLGQLRPGDTLRFRPVARNASPVLYQADGSRDRVAVSYRHSGEDYLLIEYGAAVLDLELRFRVQALMDSLARLSEPAIVDLTPGIRSLQVHYDSRALPQEKLQRLLLEAEERLPCIDALEVPSRIVHLPLSWDDPATRVAIERYMQSVREDAPWCPSNIEFIQRMNGLDSAEDVRRIVFDASYLVMGLGDVYLGPPVATPLDPRHRLVTTKYNPARTWTPENAVGIGGAYLCVYGMEGPGGYQFVGRTVQMWNRFRRTKDFSQPWLLRFFDQIRFYPVSAAELLRNRESFLEGKFDIKIEEETFRLRDYNTFLREIAAETAVFKSKQQLAFEAERERWAATEFVPMTEEPEAQEEVALPENCSFVDVAVPGNLWKVLVEPGEIVNANQPVAIVESMKMEMQVCAIRDGKIRSVLCKEFTPVSPGQHLFILEPAS